MSDKKPSEELNDPVYETALTIVSEPGSEKPAGGNAGEPARSVTEVTIPAPAPDTVEATVLLDKPPVSIGSLPEDLQPGDHIDRYTVVRKLGQGGMGSVYLVRHEALGVFRAAKVLSGALYYRGGEFVDRFLREARLACSISNPNIVNVLDVGEDRGRGLCWIIMEYVDGGTVRDVLRKIPKFSEIHAIIIAEAVAGALAAAAQQKIVHRDIKPDNIMLTRRGEVKLADLGIAKNNDENVQLTKSHVMMGTPAYLAPEQAMDAHSVDVRADIYSLGATMYEMVTGSIPYPGKSTYDILAKLVSSPVPDPRNLTDTISSGTARLIMRMLAKEAKQRPASPAALLREIRALNVVPLDTDPQQSIRELLESSGAGCYSPGARTTVTGNPASTWLMRHFFLRCEGFLSKIPFLARIVEALCRKPALFYAALAAVTVLAVGVPLALTMRSGQTAPAGTAGGFSDTPRKKTGPAPAPAAVKPAPLPPPVKPAEKPVPAPAPAVAVKPVEKPAPAPVKPVEKPAPAPVKPVPAKPAPPAVSLPSAQVKPMPATPVPPSPAVRERPAEKPAPAVKPAPAAVRPAPVKPVPKPAPAPAAPAKAPVPAPPPPPPRKAEEKIAFLAEISPVGAQAVLRNEKGRKIDGAVVPESGRLKFSVPEGQYTLQVSAPGYRNGSREFPVSRSRTISCVRIALEQDTLQCTVAFYGNPKLLEFLRREGVEVRIDSGVWKKVTQFPFKTEVSRRPHTVFLRGRGIAPQEQKVEVSSGQKRCAVEFYLAEKDACIEIETAVSKPVFINLEGIWEPLRKRIALPPFRAVTLKWRIGDGGEETVQIPELAPESVRKITLAPKARTVLPGEKEIAEAQSLLKAGNAREALEKLKAAEKLSHPEASYLLGLMAEEGKGRWFASDSDALGFYRKAAAPPFNSRRAQYRMGLFCENGRGGLDRDMVKAVEWYKKAAAAGEPDALLRLGLVCKNGEGNEPVDYQKMITCFTAAAEAGSAEAQYQLGYCCENGIGVPINVGLAKQWYEKAAAQGNENALRRGKALENIK